ncbi:hypothetical protein CY34DRAFT_803973 [Suillus luteus UH-Slu-Lm8-n1]|uniref:Uncharacterized protein n=1 Tax=Suillus luteus UH-Slu-Lm8-n1 TaxID=930992 RepID=A0A0D0AN81_9AGAM|nr:hypothetical protein CY34DRAFT_803973 [Suillus luteus UH-Slu-Lm8-n1]
MNGTYMVIIAMLCVIMIAQLHAMYQRSRMILIFLVIIFLAVNIACGVIAAMLLKRTMGEEAILFSMHFCVYGFEEDYRLLFSMIWTLNTVWEVLALSLLIWIALKHFRDLRRLGPSTGLIIRGCFRVLIKSQVFYFASFLCVFCIQFNGIFTSSDTTGVLILFGASDILLNVQMFVLGPRLILSVREYHADLVAGSDAETSMESIVFQERVHIQTSSIV